MTPIYDALVASSGDPVLRPPVDRSLATLKAEALAAMAAKAKPVKKK